MHVLCCAQYGPLGFPEFQTGLLPTGNRSTEPSIVVHAYCTLVWWEFLEYLISNPDRTRTKPREGHPEYIFITFQCMSHFSACTLDLNLGSKENKSKEKLFSLHITCSYEPNLYSIPNNPPCILHNCASSKNYPRFPFSMPLRPNGGKRKNLEQRLHSFAIPRVCGWEQST